MPGINNILPFAENAIIGQNGGVLSQDEYANDPQRLSGQSGLARSQLNNKILKQAAYMAAGIGQFIVDNATEYNVDDSNTLAVLSESLSAAIKASIGSVGKNMWSSLSDISVGDIRYTSDGNGPSWVYLQCKIAGITGSVEPVISDSVEIGQNIADGGVTWSVQRIGDAQTLANKAAALYALLDSPPLTGTPTAPTAAKTVNNNQIATTAFVQALSGAANNGGIVDSLLGQNGYMKFANGLISQWLTTTSSGAISNVTYPIPFPNKVVYVNYSMLGVGTYHGVGNVNLNSMSIYRIWYNDTFPNTSSVCVFALGY